MRALLLMTSLVVLHGSASAEYPVALNEAVSNDAIYARLTLDTSRNDRVLVSQPVSTEVAVHTLDGLANTPTRPIRISSSPQDTPRFEVNAQTSGSVWTVIPTSNVIGTPPPFIFRSFLKFDENGNLISRLVRQLPTFGLRTFHNETGVFAVNTATVFDTSSGTQASFNACANLAGQAIANCRVFNTPIAVGADFWMPRFLPSATAGADGLLQLVRLRTSGEMAAVQDIISMPEPTLINGQRLFGKLRLSVLSAGNYILFNVLDGQDFQIERAARISANGGASAYPTGSGDWLLSSANEWLHITPVTWTGNIASVTPNFALSALSTSISEFDTNVQGDFLFGVLPSSGAATSILTRYHWYNNAGSTLMNPSTLLAAKLLRSGDLITLSQESISGQPRIIAKKINRTGTAIGEIEPLSDMQIRPLDVHLSVGANDNILVTQSYANDFSSIVNAFDASGNRTRAGTFAAAIRPQILQSAQSPWLTQLGNQTRPTETLNTQTGAKFFLPLGGSNVVVGEAVYRFLQQNQTLSLQVFRQNVATTIPLPVNQEILDTAMAVEPTLAQLDEMRFVLESAIDPQTNRYRVFGVRNDVVSERFSFMQPSGNELRLIDDGAVLVRNFSNQTWIKYSTTGQRIDDYPLCGFELQSSFGNIWSFETFSQASSLRVCYTTRDGSQSIGNVPENFRFDSATIAENGDLIALGNLMQARFHAQDAWVRARVKPLQSVGPLVNSKIAVKDAHVYFASTSTLTNAANVPVTDLWLERASAVTVEEAMDQFSRIGFE
jgi:hypothetical protein